MRTSQWVMLLSPFLSSTLLIFVDRCKERICKYLGYYSSLRLVKLLSAASAIKTPLDFCLFVSQSYYGYQVVTLLSDWFESLTDSIASFTGLLVSGWFFMMYAGDNYLPAWYSSSKGGNKWPFSAASVGVLSPWRLGRPGLGPELVLSSSCSSVRPLWVDRGSPVKSSWHQRC